MAEGVESEDGGSAKSLPSSSKRSGSVSAMPESSGFKVGMPFGPITKLGIPPPHKSMPPENAALRHLQDCPKRNQLEKERHQIEN